jgi:hypothetical protein
VRDDLDIPTVAEYLAVSVQGLAVYSRLNPDATTLQRYVDTALSLVAPSTVPTALSAVRLAGAAKEGEEERQEKGGTLATPQTQAAQMD